MKKLVLRLRLPEFGAEDDKTVPMLLKDVEAQLLNELILKGIPEITKVSYTKEGKACKVHYYDPVSGAQNFKDGNWIIETDGVALKKVLAVQKVDFKNTTSNDVIEILTTLGVEAAR